MKQWRRSALLQPALLVLAACGHSMPTTLHSLSAIPPTRIYSGYAGAPVRVDSVRLPPAIDRLEMLRETSAGQYTVLEFDRWAAEPARLAGHALSEDLALRFPAGIVVTTAGGGSGSTTAVAVDILSFSPAPGAASLIVNWTRTCRPGTEMLRRSERFEAADGPTPAMLEAMLGQLADRIAADIAAHPDSSCSNRQ